MAGGNPADAGYIEVKDRIIAFLDKYPDGSLQSELVELGEDIVIMKAYAYRTPDDPRPGIGHSQMPLPGKTPFTRDSEVENAETSAWGRAIAALGFEVKKSIASAEEVANKSGSVPTGGASTSASTPSAGGTTGSDTATPAQKRKLMGDGRRILGSEEATKKFVFDAVGKRKSADLTKDDMQIIFKGLEAIEAVGGPVIDEEEEDDSDDE